MHFNACAVQRKNTYGDDALLLQPEEHIIQNTFLCPSIRSFVDAIPFAESLLIKFAPLHSCFNNKEYCFEKATIIDCDVTSLSGQIGFYRFILGVGELHVPDHSNMLVSVNGLWLFYALLGG
jgi:hypothetical protein